MLEVCFSDSVKGSLRCAQHCGEGSASAIGVIVAGGNRKEKKKALIQAKREQEQRRKEAVPIGGNSEDVAGLSFGFSTGDIQAPLERNGPRWELIRQWLSASPWGEEEEEATVQNYWDGCLADLEKLRQRADMGESVRIWTDFSPEGACGTLFAADVLLTADCRVSLVPLPLWKEKTGNTILEYSGWGEIPPEDFGKFLAGERPLSKTELRMLSGKWRTLQRENAPLRAVIGGRVFSVEQDFYDSFIRRLFPEESCTVGQLIGRVLGFYQFGIGDWLVAERIRLMISSGELKVIGQKNKGFYGFVISKAGK